MGDLNYTAQERFRRKGGAGQLCCRNMSFGPCWLPHLP